MKDELAVLGTSEWLNPAAHGGNSNSCLKADEALRGLGYTVLGYQPQELRVERYQSQVHRDLWESFVADSANGNLFSTRRFLEYHPPSRFLDHSLLFWHGQDLFAVAAGETADGAWSSQRFTSHGGLLVRPQLSAAQSLDLVYSLLRYAEKQNWNKLSMRFVPDILAENWFTSLIWALSIFGFSQDSREMTWCALPRFESEDALLKVYHESEFYAIRKALKSGLSVREIEDYPAFYSLLEAGLKDRYEIAPTHSLPELERLRHLCPGEMRLHGVYSAEGTLIGGALIFDVSAHGSHVFYLTQDYAFKLNQTMPLLMHSINVEYSIKRKRKLNYGVFTAHGGEELNVGLSRFKSKFASEPSIRRRFAWERKI